MGEVYRASDTKLKRQVALRILPPALAADADRLARFQREAEVLASLNHPNIAHIHGLEESGGTTALVMELVEGEDLSQHIARGAVPLAEALPIAKQIAEALEAAHEQGIVHRDLKPANIKVRDDGTVKVLDFGLARALDPPAGPPTGVSMSTITTPAMTQAGMILGTAAYMAPEQARGHRVDQRADIWAFGCVFYEMVTGARPFGGDNVTDTIASVVKDQPDFSRVPPPVGRLIRRCLEKDPKRRLRSVGDAWDLLDEPSTHPAARPAGPVPRLLWIGALALAVAAGAATVWLLQFKTTVGPAVSRFAHALGTDQNLGKRLDISRDGRRIAYAANGQVYVRVLDDLVARPVPGTAIGTGPTSPFFSPDGDSIAFFAQGSLMKVPVAGGTPVALGSASSIAGGSWGGDGTIVFVQSGSIWRISAEGGAPELLVRAAEDELLGDPFMLPDGRTLVYGVASTAIAAETRWDRARIMGLTRGGTPKLLVQDGFNARYVATGHLLFVLRNSLFAMPFDASRLEKTGEAALVVDTVDRRRQWSEAAYSVSDNGTLIFVPTNQYARELVWVDRQGREDVIAAEPTQLRQPAHLARWVEGCGDDARCRLRRVGLGPVSSFPHSAHLRSLAELHGGVAAGQQAACVSCVDRTPSTRFMFDRRTDQGGRKFSRSSTTPPTTRTYPVSVSAEGVLAFTRYGSPPIGNVGAMSLVQRGVGPTVLENG